MNQKDSKIPVFLITVSYKNEYWLPYATGCLISHCRKDQDLNERYDFFEPEFRWNCLDIAEFRQKLAQAKIIGLTCYVWNQSSNDKIASLYKELRPDGVVLYGGPHIPEDKRLARRYAQDRPYVDLFFVGPGEANFADFLRQWPDRDYTEYNGTFTEHSNNVAVNKALYAVKETPTVYLDGTFDSLLKRKHNFIATIETNRGCPYHCSFCDWGGLTRSKVTRFDWDTVCESAEELFRHDNIPRLFMIDANFGMFERDVTYIQLLADLKKKYHRDYVTIHFSGFAKNGSKYLSEILKIAGNNFLDFKNSIKLSFQTFTKPALSAISRDNIDNDKLLPLLSELQQADHLVNTELIIGLPGETAATWLDSLCMNATLNINFANIYILQVLPNTPLYDDNYRAEHGIKTKLLAIPNDLREKKLSFYHENRDRLFDVRTKSNFENPHEFEYVEVVVKCNSFDHSDLKKMWEYLFWFNLFYNSHLARHAMLASNLSYQDQARQFFDLIAAGQMPFFGSLLQEIRRTLDKVFSDEDLTYLDDLHSTHYIAKSIGRGREIYEIYANQAQALEEIRKIYPKLDFSHFESYTEPEMPNLYRFYACFSNSEKVKYM